jgi:glucosamine-6-phosphate isomerase
MKLFVADSYEELSRQAAADALQIMQSSVHPLICVASGDSPAGMYTEIVTKYGHQRTNISSWSFVSLDEWVGMNGSDEGSCRYHLNHQLFAPLQVPEEKICFFDGRAKNLTKEIEKVENFIQQKGGIEVAIVGLGLNGHVGMNEPGTPATIRTHVAAIDTETQKVGQKYFKTAQQLSQGITLGLATLMEAQNLFLLVSGAHKAEAVQKVLEGEISEQVPASILRRHPALNVYLDKSAAALLHTY